MEQCSYCERIVTDDSGAQTEDFGTTKRGRYICKRCMQAFEFSLGN